MKGLLIKDFKLLKNQRNFFVLIIIAALVMDSSLGDTTVIIGYLTFIGSLFTLSTISYDELDNGYPFLFSLPVTRKDYALEKYLFGFLFSTGVWLFGILIALCVSLMRNKTLDSDFFLSALAFLPIFLMLLALMLPLQLKFGGEKARIVILIIGAGVFAVSFFGIKLAKNIGLDISALANNMSQIHIGVLLSAAILVALLSLLISTRISVRIMNKKEF